MHISIDIQPCFSLWPQVDLKGRVFSWYVDFSHRTLLPKRQVFVPTLNRPLLRQCQQRLPYLIGFQGSLVKEGAHYGDELIIELAQAKHPKAMVRQIKRQGFKLALANELVNANLIDIHVAQYLCLSYRHMDPNWVQFNLDRLPATQAKIVAIDVDTLATYRLAKEAGFSRFRGRAMVKTDHLQEEALQAWLGQSVDARTQPFIEQPNEASEAYRALVKRIFYGQTPGNHSLGLLLRMQSEQTLEQSLLLFWLHQALQRHPLALWYAQLYGHLSQQMAQQLLAIRPKESHFVLGFFAALAEIQLPFFKTLWPLVELQMGFHDKAHRELMTLLLLYQEQNWAKLQNKLTNQGFNDGLAQLSHCYQRAFAQCQQDPEIELPLRA